MVRNEKELEILDNKFDRDVKIYPRWFRLLIATDQWFSVLLWNSSQDETISSHIARRKAKGIDNFFDRVICSVLRKFENHHCIKSLGE